MQKKNAISSGGLVARQRDGEVEIMLLNDKRYKEWTLPKGHVEDDETLEQAALRETREEAGIIHGEIIAKLGSFARYVEKANEHKTIHYYLIITGAGEPKGKLENDFMQTKWFPIDKLPIMYLAEQKALIKNNINLIIETINMKGLARMGGGPAAKV